MCCVLWPVAGPAPGDARPGPTPDPAVSQFQVPDSAGLGSAAASAWPLPGEAAASGHVPVPIPIPTGSHSPQGWQPRVLLPGAAVPGAVAHPGMLAGPRAGTRACSGTAAPSCAVVPGRRARPSPGAVTLQYKDRSLDEHVWVLSFPPARAGAGSAHPSGPPSLAGTGRWVPSAAPRGGPRSRPGHHPAAPAASGWAPSPGSALKLPT